MSEVEIDGEVYQCNRMPTRVQFHVGRRILPVIAALLAAQATVVDGDGNLALEQISPADAIASLMANVGSLSDADLDYVIDHALNAVRWRSGGSYVPLRASNGGLMNMKADDLATQMRLLWEVLVTSMGNFSVDKLQPSQTAAQMPTPPSIFGNGPLAS